MRPAAGNRREELVRAAFTAIARRGLEGLRLRQVAEEVGIDHSTLHHHFRTKQELVLAVAGRVSELFAPTVPDDDGLTLREHLRLVREVLAAEPDLVVVAAELDLRATRDEVVRRALWENKGRWRAALEAVARREGWRAGGVEVVLAAVKGARLVPEVSDEVLLRLESLVLR